MGSLGVASVGSDTLTLALHVLASAGFGIAYQFRSESDDASKSNINAPSYRGPPEDGPQKREVSDTVAKVFLLIALPSESLSTFCKSIHNLKHRTVEMVNAEKLRAAQGYTPEVNLLSIPVLKSAEARLLLFGDISSDSKEPRLRDFQPTKA